MREWWKKTLSSIRGDVTFEQVMHATPLIEAMTGKPFFKQGKCPFSNYVKDRGVETRQFLGTRQDN